MTEEDRVYVEETLEIMSDIISTMFEYGYAHSDECDFVPHNSYYIGPDILPRVRKSINALSSEQ